MASPAAVCRLARAPLGLRPLVGRPVRQLVRRPDDARAFSACSSASAFARQHPQQLSRARRPGRPAGCMAAAAAATPSRRYHSFDHPNEPAPQDAFGPAEQAILAAAYRHIPEHGFTEHALALGARAAGYPAISTAILPDGVFSLVRWHLVLQRTRLAARSRELFGAGDGDAAAAAADAAADADATARSPAEVADRAERLLWERLLGNRDVVDRWQEALAVMAEPSYVPASLRELALLADEIWALAGDAAVDPSWYSKRAAVSAIYAASELFMTTDRSGPDFADTREFLRRRFRESRDLGGYVRSVGEWVGFAASAGVNVLRSKGLNI